MALQSKDFSVTGKSSGGGITYTFILRVTENSVSIPNNTSNVTVQAILKQSYSGTAFKDWNTGVSCTLNGSQIFSDYKKRQLDGKQEHVYYSWTGEVSHNDDGSLLLKVGGELWQSSSASYTPPTMTIAESSTNAIALTTIPRASSISAVNADIGSCSTVVVAQKSNTFTHSIAYRFGNLSGYIDESGSTIDQLKKFSATTVNFLLPESFYNQIPNNATGICTLTCYTYDGNTQIGQGQTTQFTVTANQGLSKPAASATVVDTNQATIALTGSSSKLVSGLSVARCTIHAQARNGATISSVKIGEKAILGLSSKEVQTSEDIAGVDTNNITFQAEDSRQYLTTYTKAVDLVPYKLLTNNASIQRTDPTSGNAILTLKGTCWKGSFGVVDNALTVSYRIDNGEPVTVNIGINEDDAYSRKITISGLEYSRSYTVTVTVTDKAMSVTQSLSLHKGIPVFDWGENDFQFHVPVTGDFSGTFQGVYIRTVQLIGSKVITIKSKDYLSENSRQSVFLFGNDNYSLTYGLVSLQGLSGGVWGGTGEVSIAGMGDGRFTLTLEGNAWDWFTLISAEPFEIL